MSIINTSLNCQIRRGKEIASDIYEYTQIKPTMLLRIKVKMKKITLTQFYIIIYFSIFTGNRINKDENNNVL